MSTDVLLRRATFASDAGSERAIRFEFDCAKQELFPSLLEQHRHALGELRKQKAREACRVPIVLLDDAGNPIERFECAAHAGSEFGINPTTIAEQIRRGGHLQNGMRFARADREILPARVRQTRPVRRLSDGRKFPSLASVVGTQSTRRHYHNQFMALTRAIRRGKPFRGEIYVYA